MVDKNKKVNPTLSKILLQWFADECRALPWRESYEPYHVWISEIMGQQTQMDRVVRYFIKWMETFPTIERLAAADETTVFKLWEGLGYYSRVRNIMRTAEVLMDKHGGIVPESYGELLKLPGVGPYTAAAIMSIGFNRAYPLVDANVERLFARLEDINVPVKEAAAKKKIRKMAEELLVNDQPRLWNQALMEFGALVCTPKNPKCSSCPVTGFCTAFTKGNQHIRPVVAEKQKRIEIAMACVLIFYGDQVFIQQRLKEDLWGGLWEFPGGTVDQGETPEQAAIREVAEETEWEVSGLVPFHTVVHYYTRYRVTLHSYTCFLPNQPSKPILHAADNYAWASLNRLTDYPYPAGHRQLVQRLQSVGIPDY